MPPEVLTVLRTASALRAVAIVYDSTVCDGIPDQAHPSVRLVCQLVAEGRFAHLPVFLAAIQLGLEGGQLDEFHKVAKRLYKTHVAPRVIDNWPP